ncbi:uncharacterized protein MONBRDRAFT_33477 [Monosiga brevicollis MX1]|uniref:Ribosomal RNA methyltransferase FtsJ domain-containing protein n=1 Tax=Monosiga brevicollis TaxID=81824 RepID=A9V5K7_MONBE|nr:uncharacterized protein MONBRDRAFT_33477 [Monosiga brevicollis MX1]EDQ87056.1 predicted protein [Monosiga brevicollis MX1]|eukprot:XP_001747999.1 hypothetical protein [Monosiga brevicollis MX1]
MAAAAAVTTTATVGRAMAGKTAADVILVTTRDGMRRMIKWLEARYPVQACGQADRILFLQFRPEARLTEAQDGPALITTQDSVCPPKQARATQDLIERLSQDRGIGTAGAYVRFFPVTDQLPSDDPVAVAEYLRRFPLPMGSRLRLSVWPGDKAKPILDELLPHCELTPRVEDSTHLVSVVSQAGHTWCSVAEKSLFNEYFAMKQRGSNAVYNTGHPIGWRAVSRAYYKMDESLIRRPLDQRMRDGPLVGLDVGASPGGWSQRMAEFCDYVVAVDPAVLSVPHLRPETIPSGESPPKHAIIHIAGRIEASDTELARFAPYHLCACDMNVPRRQAMAFVRQIKPYMAIGGRLVLTIKLSERQNHLMNILAEVKDNLRALGFGNLTVFHLFANKNQEFTCVADYLSDESQLQRTPQEPLYFG